MPSPSPHPALSAPSRFDRTPADAQSSAAVRFAGCRVLMAPGLFGSGPEHWQSAWQRRHPEFSRIDQDDWSWPRLDVWARRIVESAMDIREPVVIVAHSFACLATVRASVFQSNLIAGALLVAPPNPARFRGDERLPKQALDFPTTIVASTDDPFMPLDVAREWAQIWSSDFVQLARAGHINQKSGFRQWPAGLDLLERVCRRARPAGQRQLVAA